MVRALREINDEDAKALLSSAVASLLPVPPDSASSAQIPGDLKQRVNEVIQEIREYLHIGPNDNSSMAYAKIIDFLSTLLAERIVKKADIPNIEKRLGDRGDLWTNRYKIIIRDIAKVWANYGIRPAHVEAAIRSPDRVQHFHTAEKGEGKSTSLFAKTHLSGSEGGYFTLIIEADRNGSDLVVNQAWRVYHEDVDVRSASEPLDYLVAFANRYGVLFTIGNRSVLQRFVLHDAIPLYELEGQYVLNARFDNGAAMSVVLEGRKSASQRDEERRIRFTTENHAPPHMVPFGVYISPAGIVVLSFVYVIDLSKYSRDLKRHGVMVK